MNTATSKKLEQAISKKVNFLRKLKTDCGLGNSPEEVFKEFKKLQAKQDKLGEEFKSLTGEFDQQLEGTEWNQVFRSEEAKQIEGEVQQRMGEAGEALRDKAPQVLSRPRRYMAKRAQI